MEELIKVQPKEPDLEQHHINSLKRICEALGISINPGLKYSTWELEGFALACIAAKTIKGKNLLKRMKQLEKYKILIDEKFPDPVTTFWTPEVMRGYDD